MKKVRLKILKYRNLLILGVALGFLFFGWNAAEQHLTSFYQVTEGKTSTGLNALAILYASIIIGSFLGPIFARKIGIKTSIILGFLTYTILVFGVTSKIVPLIYVLSALLGIGSGIMGVSQIDLIRIFSPEKLRGELIGSINAIRTIGGGLGVLSVSLLLKFIKIESIYLSLGTIMLIGTLILFLIESPKESSLKEKEKTLQIIKKTFLMFKESKLLLAIPLLVANGFLLGLILGAIPASITRAFGIGYVGVTMSLFHFTLSFSGLYSGKLSDRIGRFLILYYSVVTGIISALIIIFTNSVLPIILAMLFAGFFSATNGVVASALFIDMFGKKVKEAQAASGIMATLLGIVPAFILNKSLSTQNLLYLSIILCIIGAICLRILETKMIKQKA